MLRRRKERRFRFGPLQKLPRELGEPHAVLLLLGGELLLELFDFRLESLHLLLQFIPFLLERNDLGL